MTHTQGRLKLGRISHSEQSAEIDAESNTAWMDAYPWEGLAECRGCDENKTRGAAVMEANARRLVAAWNACEGIPTEVLENLADDGATIAPIYRDLLVQRDQLIDQLKDMTKKFIVDTEGSTAVMEAREAMTKAGLRP